MILNKSTLVKRNLKIEHFESVASRGHPEPMPADNLKLTAEMFQKPCLQYLILIVISVKILELLRIENHETLHYMHRMALYKYIDDSAH